MVAHRHVLLSSPSRPQRRRLDDGMTMPKTNASHPDDLPPIRIDRCEPACREPGMMLFNVRGDRTAGNDRAYRGWLMGIDQSGEIICLHRSNLPVQGVRRMPSGNLLVTIIDG